MSTLVELVSKLIEREIVPPASVVTDALHLRLVARKNQSWCITGSSESEVFIKRTSNNKGLGSTTNEARVNRELRTRLPDTVARLLPCVVTYDESIGVLAIEYLQEPLDLYSYHTRFGRFPKRFAHDIGKAMGTLHAETVEWPAIQHVSLPFINTIPSVLDSMAPPLQILESMSASSLTLIKLLQQHEAFRYHIPQIRKHWRRECLIHGDIRLSNFVTHKRKKYDKDRVLKLVDWEFAGIGDSSWDVGGVFSSFLSLWVRSIPIADSKHPERYQELAKYPIERLRPVIHTFWKSYCEARGWDHLDRSDQLARGLRYSAAHLIDAAIGLANAQNDVTAEALVLLQLSQNILTSPHQAAELLFGLQCANKGAAN